MRIHYIRGVYRPTGFVSWLAASVVGRAPRYLVGWAIVLSVAGFSPLFRGPQSAPVFDHLLPLNEPSQRGEWLARLAFPKMHAQASAVLVFARDPFLTQGDLGILRSTLKALQTSPDATEIPGYSVKSHLTDPLLTKRMLALDASNHPRAALLVVDFDLAYDSDAAVQLVERIEALAHAKLTDPTLRMEVTGTAGFARDQRRADDVAHRRITVAAIFAVLFVLLLVYRAPLAALVPLLVVGASAFVATRVLEYCRSFGLPVTTDQLTYLIVIVFGAGTDFSLFWLSRYHEELEATPADRRAAAVAAYTATMPGIVCSALTTILGLLALLASRFAPALMLGPALAFSLLVSLLAAMTLMPPLALLIGPRLFWRPFARFKSAERSSDDRWRRLASLVTRRPVVVLIALCVVLAFPIVKSFILDYRIDFDTETLKDAPALRGRALAERYFGGSSLFPWTLLVQFKDAPARGQVDAVCDAVDQALTKAGARDVWSLDQPLGRSATGAGTLLPIFAPRAADLYYNANRRVLRFEVMAGDFPFSPDAVHEFERTFPAVQQIPQIKAAQATVLATGPSPLMANLRSAARVDEWRIKAAVIAAVGIVVVLLLHDLILAIALLLITLLAYQATMGLAGLFFVGFMHQPAINWQVSMFAFVILMAVGQDYNLFLLSRLNEERTGRRLRPAVRRALVRTGRIISSCGLITAVSLGTLLISGQTYLIQMGFALAVGTLLDTFVIRPLLLPALLLILGRPRVSPDVGGHELIAVPAAAQE
jgi:RND superfamily putative drug exporter